MSNEDHRNRNYWKRVAIPPEMHKFMLTIAFKHGFDEEQMYLFFYQAVRKAYPEDAEREAPFFDLPELPP